MTSHLSNASQGKFRPPDGGWGWVVVISSFIIHFIMDGITYSLGTYLPIFTEFFDVSHGAAGVIHALLPAITLGCGPIASIFTNHYGCRLTTIIGALIASFGFVVAYIAHYHFALKSIFTLYFSIGIIVGFGFGLVYVPAIVAVGFYFEKKRSFAIGIAVCGTGAGTFLLSPFNRILIHNYGWEGAFLVKAAIILNIIVCGLVMRPVEVTSSEAIQTESSTQLSYDSTQNKNKKPEQEPAPAKPPMMVPPAIVIQDVDEKRPDERKMNKIADSLPLIYGKENETQELKLNSNGAVQIDVNEFAKSMPMITFTSSKSALQTQNKTVSFRNSSLDIMAHVRSFQNIHIQLDSNSSKDSHANSSLVEGNHYDNTQTASQEDSETEHTFISAIKNSIDFSLFTNSVFLLFAFSNFLTSLGFNAPFIYIIDQAIKKGIDATDADWLLSTIGISNTFGRIILGFISDKENVNRLFLYGFVLTVCGISTIIEPFLESFSSLLIYAIVFGFTSGGYVSLTSVLIVDLLGLENLTNAFGILLVFQGLATAIGPPTVGLLFDIFNSYEFPFAFTGAMIMFSGLMCFTIPRMKPSES